MDHIIRTQVLHVELAGTEADGLALQRSLPDLCQQQLLLVIEQVLDRCAPPDGQLYIEHLDIDAGALSYERLPHDLADRVAQALEKAIREQVRASESNAGATPAAVQHKTGPQSVYDAWIHFLKHGTLPWSFRLPPGTHLEQTLLNAWRNTMTRTDAARTDTASSSARAMLLRTLGASQAQKRLVRQFSPETLPIVLAWLSPEAWAVMEAVLQALHAITPPAAETAQFEQSLWETIFAEVARAHVPTVAQLVSAAWRAQLTSTEQQTALSVVLLRLWPDVMHAVLTSKSERRTPHESAESAMGDSPKSSALRPGQMGAAALPSATASDDPKQVAALIADGLYVEHAGLVLLHPFLPLFFEALGIAADDKLLQPNRALCLLHFLATGERVAPEYALTLAKILCEVPLTTSPEPDVALTAAEEEECAALLTAVIRHWDALRDTGIDGLRGTFLIRPGKVSQDEDGDWRLQVESQAFDILLEQLPWGIGLIKLPWMTRMLRVEWR